MSNSENQQVVLKFFGCLNQRELGELENLLNTTFVWHGNNNQNREDYHQDVSGVIAAFPDAEWKIDDCLDADDKVIVRWTFQGTHENDWEKISATKKRIQYSGISICHLFDGKIAEVWNNENLLSLYRQMGFQINPPKRRKWWQD